MAGGRRGEGDKGLDTRARRIVANRLRQLLACREVAVRRGDPDSIHDVRVATRRLQEAIDLFAPILPERERGRLRRRARRVRRQLAPLRDADVLAELTASLPSAGAFAPDLTLAPLALRLQWRSRQGGVRVPGIRRRGRDLLAACRAAPPGRSPVLDTTLASGAKAALRRRAEEVATVQRETRVGRAADVHRLRIAVKRYRYTMELLALAAIASPGRAVEEARRVQEALGALHDLDVLLALLRGRAAARPLVAQLARARRERAAAAGGVLASFRPWSAT